MGSWTERDQRLFERIRDSGPSLAQADGAGPEDQEPPLVPGDFSGAGSEPIEVMERVLAKGRPSTRANRGIEPFHQTANRVITRPAAT